MSGVGSLVASGPLILAIPVAAAAGAITFLSPCCLPLIPGYLSYVTGMSGADAQQAEAGGQGQPAGCGRTVAGAALIVLGFSALFAAYGAAFGGLGGLLLTHQRELIQVLGVVTILLGLLFAGVFDRFSIAGPDAAALGPPARRAGRARRCSGCCSAWAGHRASGRRWPRCSGWPRPPAPRAAARSCCSSTGSG